MKKYALEMTEIVEIAVFIVDHDHIFNHRHALVRVVLCISHTGYHVGNFDLLLGLLSFLVCLQARN